MDQKTNVLCTICARGGSKGVFKKNIRGINGKPLIAYSIEQALESNLFDHVVVSTDCDDIASIAKQYGAEVFFKRDPDLSSDASGKVCVIRDAFIRSEEYYRKKFNILVDLDATSPLRTVFDIKESINQFLQDDNDNLITGSPSRRSPYFNLVEKDFDGNIVLSKQLNKSILRRQDAPMTYDMNASIYIWKRSVILKENTLFLSNTGIYVMPESRSLDIDTELDFKIVDYLLHISS